MNDGGPAFPRTIYDDDCTIGSALKPCSAIGITSTNGMSLRDWFAGQVLGSVARDLADNLNEIESEVAFAYTCADAMLKAREELT